MFNEETLGYLNDDTFSNKCELDLRGVQTDPFFKIPLLEALVKDKSIIHLGCTDHFELIEEKIQKNTWVHKRLDEAAKDCWGIDINEKAINFLKENHGYKNLLTANIIDDDIDLITQQAWDYVVLGELLEHIENPQHFLKTIRAKCHRNIDRIILTVPNAFFIRNILHSWKNKEVINSNHCFWFSPYTICKLLVKSGYEIEHMALCQGTAISKKFFLVEWLLKARPLFRNTIVVTAKLNP